MCEVSTKIEDGGPAFPTLETETYHAQFGMSLRDWFAANAPEPTKDAVQRVLDYEQAANPHNEPYHNKVRRRGELEIRCALRFEWADQMLKARKTLNSPLNR